MVQKSGRATGAGRPSGTAEQRAYHGARYSPSGTPRTTTISPAAQRVLKSEIEAHPEKFEHLHAQYGHLWEEGYYPYVVNGKAVTKATYQTYEKAEIEKLQRAESARIREAGRTQAERPLTRQEAFMEAIKAKTPKEKFETALRLQVIEKERQPKEIFKERIEQAKTQQQIRKLIQEKEPSFLERLKRKPDESYIAWSRRTQQEVRDWRYRVLEKVERKMGELVVAGYKVPEKPTRAERYFGGLAAAIPSGIISVAKFEAKPITAIREELIGFKELPSAFKADPFGTAAEIAGGLTAFWLGGKAIKAAKIKKQPKIKVQVSKKVITEYDPIKKGVKYYREQALVKVYEKVKNKWRLKETLTPEAFYETYGIKEIGIGPIIKKKAEVTFRTKTGQAITETFSKDLLGIIERTALGKQPTLAVGGIIIKRGGKIYTGDLLGVGRRIGRRETFGLADIAMGKDRITGIGISRRLIQLVKDKKVLEIGREVGIAKGPRVRNVFFGEYVFKPLVEKPKVPVTFLAPSPLALERIAKLKFFVPVKVIKEVVEKIVTPKVKYPKGILFGATAGIIKPTIAQTFFTTEEEAIEVGLAPFPVEKAPPSPFEIPKPVYVPKVEEGVYVPREEFMMGIGAGQIERIKQQVKQTTSSIQQEKEQIKQIPKEDVIQIQSAQQRLAILQQQKVLQRQQQKQAQKQLQQLKQVQAQVITPMITPTITPGVSFPFITPKPSLLKAAIKKLRKQKVQAFELFIKRKGKFEKITGAFPKAKAIELGAKLTKEELAATFKILPTKEFIIAKPSKLRLPSPEIFRAYKIKKGVRVPLELEWIQKRGKRLITKSERRAIQKARTTSFFKTSKKKKGGNLWWD